MSRPEQRQEPVCPDCGRAAGHDPNFCPYCGRPFKLAAGPALPLPPPRTKSGAIGTIKLIIGGIGTYSVLVLLFLTIANVLILIWSVSQVVPQTPFYHTYLFVITPWIINLVELTGTAFAIYHVLLVIAIVLSFIFLLWKSRRLFLKELAVDPSREERSPLYIVGTIFFAVLFFNIVYYLVLSAMGITPAAPGVEYEELWKVLYSFAHASVWEEIVSRMLLIGVPLLLLDLMRRKRKGWKRYFLGGGFELGRAEIALLLASSTIFSLAHIFSWDAFKLPPTFIAGFALGYLFLSQGIYAAIMLHFVFDYLSVPTLVFEGYAALILVGLLIFAWVAIGALYFVNYSSKAIGFVLGRKVWPNSIAGEVKPAPTQASVDWTPRVAGPSWSRDEASLRFICRYCGYDEARYVDGGFECARCGRRN
ncbi:MAG: CPBP family intramembrane metalloprotease [Euryarchaeota archaeon]|nr:CPBP family intramembrane metalloprotease [Euryarchaeota archaeon]